MTLRAKLTVSVALLVAVAIALSGWLAVDAASRELNQGVDAFLRDRVDAAARQGLGQRGGRGTFEEIRGGVRDRRPRRGLEAVAQDDSVTQVIAGDGRVLELGSVSLPVSLRDLAIASGQGSNRLRTSEVDGTKYRIITANIGHGNALMVARDLSEVDSALDGLARRTLILGLVGSALAALVAWVLASRLSRPINRLTEAAEHVAATQDLESSIDVDAGGEVGRLADSLNTMLDALDTS
ncbi:MAG: HAMP domain-containing protein, partial [Acidimicrobiales bacterium]